MLKSLRYIFLACVAVVLLSVASANRTPVVVRLLPTDLEPFVGFAWAVELPLFLVIFAGVILGLFIGFVWEWIREARLRSEAIRHRRKIGDLEREMTRLRQEKGDHKDDVLAILDSQ